LIVLDWFVDPDCLWHGREFWFAVNEALRSFLECGAHDGVAVCKFDRSEASMNVGRCQHGNTRMPVLGIIIRHEGLGVASCVFEGTEAIREVASVLTHK